MYFSTAKTQEQAVALSAKDHVVDIRDESVNNVSDVENVQMDRSVPMGYHRSTAQVNTRAPAGI